MTDQLHFRFVLRDFPCEIYEVCGDGPPYRLEVRYEAGAHERSMFNADGAKWQRDAGAAIGLLCSKGGMPVTQRVVDLFNAWRAAEHAKEVEHLCSRPEHYGVTSEKDPRLAPPVAVRGAHFDVGKGAWVVHADPRIGPDTAPLTPVSPIDQPGPSP